MDGKDAEHFLERAKDLLELAGNIKSDTYRKLLIESAEKFLNLAIQALGSKTER